MKYQIIENSEKDKFEEEVAEALSDGWECQGGVFVFREQYHLSFFQAMTKEPTGFYPA
jgi:hypothetical protein